MVYELYLTLLLCISKTCEILLIGRHKTKSVEVDLSTIACSPCITQGRTREQRFTLPCQQPHSITSIETFLDELHYMM